ncbi:MAG: hypothetical protein IH831_04075 [Planctomycetes bacterium]|nr:hypothetical protein [Planctomycetota bacterium]
MDGRRWRRWLCCAVCFWSWTITSVPSWAEETTVRVRLAWGSGANVMQRWSGQISIEGATLTELQPLGIEADEAAALRIEANEIVVAPLVKRRFDGCDVTVRAQRQATLRIKLRSEQSPQLKVIETTLDEIVHGQFRAPLDDFGSFLLAYRSPGDKLRVIPPGKSLVFGPGEPWSLRLQPDLAAETALGTVLLNLQLRAVGSDKVLWQAGQTIVAETLDELTFDIVCPVEESAYRITIEARAQEGLAGRFVPWQQAKVFASRDVEFVVIDPAAKLPPLVDRWLPVLSVDPANPSWWQRLPNWAQVSRLRGRPPGAVGNVRPVVRPAPTGDLVELPPSRTDRDPYWQAYTLPVKEPGTPHLIEVEYPVAQQQHLSISVIEPDAAGRVTTPNVDAGVFTHESRLAADGQSAVYRIVFWPRTRSPQLLLVNRHSSQPAQFGKLTLLRHDDQAAAEVVPEQPVGGNRLVAGYISKPMFAANFGAAELLDSPSGVSVQGWSTFLEGANRLARYLKLCGYNGALLTVAADGSALYPSDVLNPSPRYDTGLLAAKAPDPTRKDVLEMLLRVFDREGLRLVPTLQLATPLPRLEALLTSGEPPSLGIEPVNHTGQTWLMQNAPSAGLGAYYNPLNEAVQAEVVRLVAELSWRYGAHQSFAGVGVQVSGEGYAVLPGLAWALDDQTIGQFCRDTNVTLPNEGADRFLRRAKSLVGPHRQAWQSWRTEKMVEFYTKLAGELAATRDDLQLVLTTEDVFAGQLQQWRIREALSGPVQIDQLLRDHGLDLVKLQQQEQITVLSPYRLGSESLLQQQALDLRINMATEQGEFLPLEKERGLLVYHLPTHGRLTSFDRLSPYGAAQTHLSLSSQSLPAGATVRKQLVTALARRDAQIVVNGGPLLPLGQHAELRRVLQTLQQLPDARSEVRTQSKQPLVWRVYRTAETTTVLLMNESQWSLGVHLPLEATAECAWRKLGEAVTPTPSEPQGQAGTLAAGNQIWQLELEPYDLQAWTFSSAQLRVDEPEVTVDAIAKIELQQRIDEIESRTGNLNIQRPYLQLQNPGFELIDGGERIFGWQPSSGARGAISLTAGEAHTGRHALRLQSEDASGVAIESHLMPMPKTGQLVIGAFVRGRNIAADARLYISIEDGENGRNYRQFATWALDQLPNGQWSRYEFSVDDIPFDTGGQMRVEFHLTGQAELLIDDVELCDLRFESARRRALVKRNFAAKTALDEGQVIDCQRLVDGYWSRYLVEHVPPVKTVSAIVAKQPPAPKSEPEEPAGLGDRLRGWLPKIWR